MGTVINVGMTKLEFLLANKSLDWSKICGVDFDILKLNSPSIVKQCLCSSVGRVLDWCV